MKRNFLMMLLLAFTLSGCGSKDNSAPGNIAPVNTNQNEDQLQTFINVDELKAALNMHTVVCGEPGDTCPSYVAKLTFWGRAENKRDFYLGVCSASLYQGKYIITNSHCIPREIAKDGADCSDQIKVIFPKTKYYKAEDASCKSIVQVYNPSLERPDIAVIELDHKLVRDSIEIAKNGFTEGGNVTSFTMNPSEEDLTVGTITKKLCVLSTDNAYFMSTDSSAATAMVSGTTCDIIHGNSGSALLNKNSKMIGVVFARMEVAPLTKALEKNNINFTSKVPMGLVQNISCLNEISSSAGTNCNLSSPTVNDFNDFVERSKVSQNLAAVNDSQIEYELTTAFKLKLKEVAAPAINKDLSSFKEYWTKIFFRNGNTSEAAKILKRFTRK